MLRSSALLVAVLGCTLVLGVSGCGSSSSSSSASPGAVATSSSSPAAAPTASTPTTHFAKTKFLFHLGLAGGAFHHFIYRPFKAGVFGRPASHKAALFGAAVAALFTYHELKLAAQDVKSSRILSALFSPITALVSRFQALRGQFLRGKYSPADINATQADGGAISQAAQAKGYPNGDIASKIPGIAGS